MEEKKKKVLPRIFLGIFIFFFIIILAVSALIAFCAFDKKQPLSVIPHDYSVYVHADSAWDTVEPMLDLKAMDMFLSAPELSEVRGIFMQLRASQWRKNKILSSLASKTVDGAFYKNKDNKVNFIFVIDLEAISFVSRGFPFLYDKLNIKGLFKENDHFIYDANGTYYYIKPYKNLIVATDNPELLDKAFEEDYNNYSSVESKLFSQKSDGPVKIIANISSILDLDNSNLIMEQLDACVPENSLSLISLQITDENIKIDAEIPVSVPQNEGYLLGPILSKKSTAPSILSRFRENVHYYTVINAGTLEELKTAFLPLVLQDSDKTWKKADSLSKSLFNLSLEDLLFSWSGTEFAMFGLENRNNPVFAIQIKDEKQRQKVFDKFTSSMVIKHNASLILDGVRIPRLELPAFLQDLLKLFDVSLPHPYYFIHDGFIYFSESAENLCEIYKSSGRLEKISQHTNWNTISKGLSLESSISLYYNLEQSIPFFLKSKASLSNILSLYQIGRADLEIENNSICIHLSAISKDGDIGNVIPGFPVSLEGKVDGNLLLETTDSKAKTNALYWVENKNTIASMEIPSTTVNRVQMKDDVYIAVCPVALGKGVLWAVTSHGEIYLLNRKLETLEGFPKIISEDISVAPAAASDGINIITESGHLYWFNENGNSSERYLDISGSVKASPSISEDSKGNRFIGIYDKSFFGKVIVLREGNEVNTYVYNLPGIAFGSPSFLFAENSKLPFVSLITQSGEMHIWNMETEEDLVIKLEGMFKTSPVACGNYFFVVSTEGVLYRVDSEGNFIEVEIPNLTCNEAFITVINNNIYVCPDGNIIYGFDTNLELLYPFPVTGWGRPVFTDVNGDNTTDCFTLSIDNKLNAIQMR